MSAQATSPGARALGTARRVAARGRAVFPLTPLGALVGGLGAVGLLGFGLPRVDYAAQLVGAAALALVGVALVVTCLGALLLARATRSLDAPDGATFEARRGFARLLTLPRFRWLLLLEVSWDWVSPEGFRVKLTTEDGALVEQVESARRALVESVRRRFVVEDAFGLTRLELLREARLPLQVTPWAGALDRAPMLRALAAGEELAHPAGDPLGDRVDLRRYVHGDPLKLALWKVYARTRQLMVRTPERALAPALRVVAYLPSARGDEAAAAAARVAIDGGLLGERWRFSADGAARPTSDPAAARTLILTSRDARGTDAGDAAGLAAFVDEATREEPVRIVVFVPGRRGPWLERVTRVAAAHAGRVHAVIAVDGVRDPEATGPARLERWLKVPEAPREEDEGVVEPEALEDVALALTRAGVEVLAVERPSGRTLALGAAGGARRAAAQGTASSFGVEARGLR
jgi:uncharacterized protein (DUF58 family)